MAEPTIEDPAARAEPARALVQLVEPHGESAFAAIPRPVGSRGGDSPRTEPRPVLPAWLGSRTAFRDAATWNARRSAHVAAFHALRLPLYWLRLIARSPLGLARLTRGWFCWAADADGRTVRAQMTAPGADPAVFLRLSEQHRRTASGRATVSAVVLVLAGLVLWSGAQAVTASGLLAGTVGLLLLLGLLGRSPDRPVTSRAVDSETVPPNC